MRAKGKAKKKRRIQIRKSGEYSHLHDGGLQDRNKTHAPVHECEVGVGGCVCVCVHCTAPQSEARRIQ